MDIKLKLENENKKLEILVEKKEDISKKIKDTQVRIKQYEAALDKERYDKFQSMLAEKGMNLEEAMKMLSERN
jgi:phosphotransacetylase